ncbi:MAG: glycosyltransferase family 4 protein [Fervidobacterium sp.]
MIYITSTLPYGIAESCFFPEIKALINSGVELKIVPMRPRGEIVEPEAFETMPFVEGRDLFSSRIFKTALKVFIKHPLRVIKAFFLILTSNPHYLLINIALFPKALWLADLATKYGAQHIHVHWASSPSTMAMVASYVSKVPWSLTAHRGDIVENYLLKRKARHVEFFRCISNRTKELALERGVPNEKITVLHLGVDVPEEITYSAPKKHSREIFVVFCPAFLVEVKGHRYLIEALLRLPENVHLWLAGDGPLRKDLEEFVNKLKLQHRVKFLGLLKHSEILNMYRENKVDVVVLASVDLGHGVHEGIPVALIEAMAYGYPVIGTNTGGIPELLGNGAGLLVQEKSSEELAKAILQVMENEDYRRMLSLKARKRIEEEFSAEKVAKVLISKWSKGKKI